MVKLKTFKDVKITDLVQDPYPTYNRMRDISSPCQLTQLGQTIVARTDDIQYIQSTPDRFAPIQDETVFGAIPNRGLLGIEDADITALIEATINDLAGMFQPNLLTDLIEPILDHLSAHYLPLTPDTQTILRHIMGTTIAGLLENRDQLLAIQFQNEWFDAVEEAIRWCSPLQFQTFTAAQDVNFRQYLVPNGTVLICAHAAANHDPKIWQAAHLFNAYRAESDQRTWSNGLGLIKPIIDRLLGKTLLPILFDTFPDMELDRSKPPKWSGFRLRGPTSLYVKLQ